MIQETRSKTILKYYCYMYYEYYEYDDCSL